MNKSVVVTGAAGGIGEALCAAFAQTGYFVVGVDVRPLPRVTDNVVFVEIDLDRICQDRDYRHDSLHRLRIAAGARPIGALVNNAAAQVVKPTAELTVDDWSRTLNVNTLAPFLLTQALLPELEAARGAVVNVSSIHATLTKPDFVAYATSKAALNGLTRSLAVDLGGRVRVNAICPAAIATPMLIAGFAGREAELRQLGQMHPAGRIGEPSEVAALALFLVSDAALFITGATYAVDGGMGGRLHDPV
jgi:NAD(P)-dependent dehydrogenase (short-subunit alcohol dehydrogenase family)